MRRSQLRLHVSSVAVLILCAGGSARADSTVCVNPSGARGCSASIQAAIDSVSTPKTTIMVEAGTYKSSCSGPACSVASIRSSAPNGSALTGLALRCGDGGGGSRSVHLDATGLDHAVYVGGVNGVKIEGCVAENARREGILVESADGVRIVRNEVTNNDEAMADTAGKGTPACPTFLPPGTPGTNAIQCCPDAFPGGPGGFPYDNDDCGEGIHLRGVTGSVVENNSVHDNIGGILLTDETGPTSNNLVVGNTSSQNLKFGGDCGVTIASHLACSQGSSDATGCQLAPPSNGVFQGNGVTHNAVVGNVAKHNGASGVGMFANPGIPPGAATNASANLVAGNTVTDNGEPGIAIHVHAANGSADHNLITGNVLSGNGGDEEAQGASPPGTGIEIFSNKAFPGFAPAAPIAGTVVAQNRVLHQDVDVWVGNTATSASVFLNDLLGPNAIGVQNAGSGELDATDDWWGCAGGPNTPGCSSTVGDVTVGSFLSQPVNATTGGAAPGSP